MVDMPLWMTVRAEEVRTLPKEEWGPWAEGVTCVRGFPGDNHPVEEPHFFYCRHHMDVLRSQHPVPRPHKERDLGLCVKCKEPAEPDRSIVRLPTVACVEAEKLGITVARLSTRKFCDTCDPWANPFCTWDWCKKELHPKGKRNRALPKGCCKKTLNTKPHCQRCHDLWLRSRGNTARYTYCQAKKCQPCNTAAAKGKKKAKALECWHQNSGWLPHCQNEHDRLMEDDRRRKKKNVVSP